MPQILNKCPICGSRIQYSRMMSFTYDSVIKLNGELSAKQKKGEAGSLECGFISCTNKDCDFVTDCDFTCCSVSNNRVNRIKVWQQGSKFYYDDSDL